DRHGVSFCGSAQLVRAALFSAAFAGPLRQIADVLHHRVRGARVSDRHVRFAAAPFSKRLVVKRNVARLSRHLEYTGACVARGAGPSTRPAETRQRLVMDHTNRTRHRRAELAWTRVLQSRVGLRPSANRTLVSRSPTQANATGVAGRISAL